MYSTERLVDHLVFPKCTCRNYYEYNEVEHFIAMKDTCLKKKRCVGILYAIITLALEFLGKNVFFGNLALCHS
jgi:hypothetical protein